jgi:hypothetical protein
MPSSRASQPACGPALDGGAWSLFSLSVFVDFVTLVFFVLKIVTREASVTEARR